MLAVGQMRDGGATGAVKTAGMLSIIANNSHSFERLWTTRALCAADGVNAFWFMSITFRRVLVVSSAFLGGLALPGLSSAHSLLLTCKPAADSTVRCVGEFSDGSDAVGMTVLVKAYDERVLFKGTLGGDSSLHFKRPAGEFFVRIEDGGEHSAEVDHTDVKP